MSLISDNRAQADDEVACSSLDGGHSPRSVIASADHRNPRTSDEECSVENFFHFVRSIMQAALNDYEDPRCERQISDMPEISESLHQFLTDLLKHHFGDKSEPEQVLLFVRLINVIQRKPKAQRDTLVLETVNYLPSIAFNNIIDLLIKHAVNSPQDETDSTYQNIRSGEQHSTTEKQAMARSEEGDRSDNKTKKSHKVTKISRLINENPTRQSDTTMADAELDQSKKPARPHDAAQNQTDRPAHRNNISATRCIQPQKSSLRSRESDRQQDDSENKRVMFLDREKEANRNGEIAAMKNAEVLLVCFSSRHKYSGMKVGIWFQHFSLLSPSTQTAVLNALLRAANGRLERMLAESIPDDPCIQGLQRLITSHHCSSAFATLLKDEVNNSQNKPGNLFEKTELGRLLSVSLIPRINFSTHNLERDRNAAWLFNAYRHLPDWPKPHVSQEDDVIQVFQRGVDKIQAMLRTAFTRLLESDEEDHVAAAMTWAEAVANSNVHRARIVDPTLAIKSRLCGDAYMHNFCGLLLHRYGLHVLKFQPADLCCAASLSCHLQLSDRDSLGGGIIPRLNKEDLKEYAPGLLSHYFHLCQQVISIGSVLSMLHSKQLQQSFVMRNLDLLRCDLAKEYLIEKTFLQKLKAKVVWNEKQCKLVTSFYIEMCKLLSEVMPKSEENASESTPKWHEEMFLMIPQVYWQNMADWFTATSQIGLVFENIEGPLTDFCIDFLKCVDLFKDPHLQFKVFRLLFTLASHERYRVRVEPKLRQNMEVLISAFFRIYVDISANTRDGITRRFCYDERWQMAKFFLGLLTKPDYKQLIYHEASKDSFSKFLCAVLNTMFYYMGAHAYTKRTYLDMLEKAECGFWDYMPAKKKLRRLRRLEECHLDTRNTWAVVTTSASMLKLFSDWRPLAVCFVKPPLTFQVASAIRCMILHDFDKSLPDSDQEQCRFELTSVKLQLVSFFVSLATLDPRDGTGFIDRLAESPHSKRDLPDCFYSKFMENVPHEEQETYFPRNAKQVLEELKDLQRQRLLQVERETTAWARDGPPLQDMDADVLTTYKHCMSAFQCSMADLTESHAFRAILAPYDPGSLKTATLEGEWEELPGSLVVSRDSLALLLRDANRMDVLRIILSGPARTPYSRGLFVLDVFCPEDYPSAPPLVRLLNPGHDVEFEVICRRINREVSEKMREPLSVSLYDGSSESISYSLKQLVKLLGETLFERGLLFGRGDDGEGETPGNDEVNERKRRHKTQCYTLYNATVMQLRLPFHGTEQIVRLHFTLLQNYIFNQYLEWHSEYPGLVPEFRLMWHLTEFYHEVQKLNASILTPSVGNLPVIDN